MDRHEPEISQIPLQLANNNSTNRYRRRVRSPPSANCISFNLRSKRGTASLTARSLLAMCRWTEMTFEEPSQAGHMEPNRSIVSAPSGINVTHREVQASPPVLLKSHLTILRPAHQLDGVRHIIRVSLQSTQCRTLRIMLHLGWWSERDLPCSQYACMRCSKPFALFRSSHASTKPTSSCESGGIK